LSEKFLILKGIGRDIYEKLILVFVSSTRYSCQIFTKLEFPDRFSPKMLKNQMSLKSVQCGAQLLHADRRTEGQGDVNSRFSLIFAKSAWRRLGISPCGLL